MMRPAVSVIMPAFNRAGFIGSAIASVRAQSFRDWELLVVDDGSSDDTVAIACGHAAEDDRIRVTANAGKAGPGGARNHGSAMAEAEWLAFLDSDDLWEPDKLALFLEAAIARPALVASDYVSLDRDSGTATRLRDFILGVMMPWWRNDEAAAAAIPCARIDRSFAAIAEPDLLLSMTIGGGLWIQTSSAMVRADLFRQVGGFDANLMRTEDFDLWIRLFGLGAVAYLDRPLATYDITRRSLAEGARYGVERRHTPYLEARYHLRLLQRLAERFSLTPPQRRFLRERIAAHHRMCAHRAGPGAGGIGHALMAAAGSPRLRRLLAASPAEFFRRPY
ncbi:MAG TPA: glycosyltransferase family 2 protein [Candidatus Udaeobacter sp.]|nr:glycosyltransferase family 2 protein [Candidatus Udaeobacter sp.]